MASDLEKRQVQERLEREKREREERQRTFGEKMADAVNRGMGSWRFILIQTGVILVWVAANTFALAHHWDPYPFLLMNICLSLQAAYAAPLIQLSQNRAQDRDAILQEFLRVENEKEEKHIEEILALLKELREEQRKEPSRIVPAVRRTQRRRVTKPVKKASGS